MNESGETALQEILRAPKAKALFEDGSIVKTRFLDSAEAGRIVNEPQVAAIVQDLNYRALVEHERAPFVNYPQEWPAEMLHAAGLFTIELALSLMPDGIGLKDATPSNVMFWGPKPVFIDVLSFERRDPHDPTWLPYGQFVRTFLLPLLANRRYRLPTGPIFMTRRDGLEPEELYPLLGPFERIRPRSFSLISFPVWFGKKSAESEAIYRPRMLKNPEQAQYILRSLLRRQKRALKRLRPAGNRSSQWSDYTEGNNNYSAAQSGQKVRFVSQCLAETRPAEVLDVGSNTGVFSILAAESGSRVVAIDYDPVVVGRLWETACQKQLPILPLVVNLARPTPALGWLNAESRSFLDRARGAFDGVLMLALIHHLLVTERIPLPEILETARGLTRKWLIIEYVDPKDSMFRRLTRGRAHLHESFNQQVFEEAARRYFRIVRSEPLAGTNRCLYLMEAGA